MIDRIMAVAEQRGLTQGRIEKALGLPVSRISKWKDNKGEPTASQALQFARFLGVPLEWLVDEQSGATPPPPEITETEKAVIVAMRGHDMQPEEVIRLIVRARSGSGYRSAGNVDITPQVLAEEKAARAGRKSGGKPGSDDERPDSFDVPGRVRRPR